MSLISLPGIAQAGVFSFVTNLFAGPEETALATQVNSQTIPLLAAEIGPNPNFSSGGGEVTIVDDSALMSESSPSNSADGDIHRPASDQISMYVVRSGDSLSGIASMFGVSVNTILWTNDLSSKTVKEGQVLVILPVSGVRHTVKAGDTVASIAKKYGGDEGDIRSYNNLEGNAKLAVGSEVIIPDGEIAASVTAKPAAKKSNLLPNSSAASLSTNTSSTIGYYMRPLKGGVKTQGIHGFNGIDIGTPVGTTLYAAAEGSVIVAKNNGGWNGGYGNYVVIAHPNGTQTLYGHMSNVIVSVGQKVVQGQIIGYSGNTGKSTGPHLHFEVRGAKNPF